MSVASINLVRLARGVQKSRELMRPFIDQRRQLLQMVAGSRYGGLGSVATPIPFMGLLYGVLMRALVSANPRCLISTKVQDLRPVAAAMQIAINERVRQAKLADALSLAAADALVGMGVIKVGVGQTPIEGADGWVHDHQETYCDSIGMDDFVFDMGVNRWDRIGYCGHRLYRPRRALELDPRYDQGVVANLPSLERSIFDENGEMKAEGLSRADDPGHDCDHEDMVELWEIWLPRERVVLLLPADRAGIVRTTPLVPPTEYQGPEWGPYHLLRLGELPDNIMPVPPLLGMGDLHTALNGLYRKILWQGLNQKNTLAVMGGAEEDADRQKRARDGDFVRSDHPDGVQERSWGNYSAQNLALFLNAREMANYYAGNPESFAGLAAQSETLGQDRLLSQSASRQIQGYQDKMAAFTKGVMECKAWYWWAMPETYQVDVPLEGMPGETVPTEIDPSMREGHWLHLNFTLEPYSLQSESPGTKLSNVNALMGQLAQWLPVMQQQGLAPNVAEYLRLVASYGNMPEVEQLVMGVQPMQEELQEPPKMPGGPQGTRTYERVSRSAPTQASRGNAQMMAALGAANQQQAAMNGSA